MRISIVVPAFNEEKLLPQVLASIRAASAAFVRRGWDVELIVCDNNSTDRTPAIAREAGAIVVFEPLNQISRARNAGAARSRGDCLAGGVTVRYEDARLDVRLAVAAWNAVSRLLQWAAGSFIFCEAAAFRAAGGFSEELYAGEEIDLFRRLKRPAHARRRRIVVLHRHPLLSSDRKARLYRWSEMALFLVRMIASGGRSLRSRAACQPWYDGRR